MNHIVMETPTSPEYLLTQKSDKRYEWINDQLREKPPMGAKANRAATILIRLLDAFTFEKQLGLVFVYEVGFRIFAAEPKKVRKPDISFIARGRLPNDEPPSGYVTIPPDLEVEVVPPNDEAEEIERRVADYLGAGVRLMWIIYPTTRSVWVVRKDGTAARLTEDQELSGEDVVPDFKCPLRTLFAGR
jgi:Uma2 family endonuclease